MKKLILINLFCFLFAGVYAQAGSDSLAYQLQRKKINGMLAQRAQKFGQYDQSLKMHTGIFGLQTKKDIKRSQGILMDIIRTDDAVYRELKILLEFRTYQQSQVQSHYKQADNSNTGFMTTINKLRQDNDRLKAEAQEQQHQQARTKNIFIIVFVLMLASILFLVSRKNKRKA
jgi:hypothetical protein